MPIKPILKFNFLKISRRFKGFKRFFILLTLSFFILKPIFGNSNKLNFKEPTVLNTSFESNTSTSIILTEKAENPSRDGSKKEEFNATTMIMEHVSDSHEWHLFMNYSIPLPIMIITDAGFDIFSSTLLAEGKIYHGHKMFKLIEDKIKVVDYRGSIISSENGFFKVLDLSITKNVLSLFFSVGILLVVFIGIAKTYKGDANRAPKGIQSLLEPFILFIRDDIALPNLGKNYIRFMPFLLTLFFFIWINNILGLLPFFPGGANLT